jgi:hypothetical protein
MGCFGESVVRIKTKDPKYNIVKPSSENCRRTFKVQSPTTIVICMCVEIANHLDRPLFRNWALRDVHGEH